LTYPAPHVIIVSNEGNTDIALRIHTRSRRGRLSEGRGIEGIPINRNHQTAEPLKARDPRFFYIRIPKPASRTCLNIRSVVYEKTDCYRRCG
jgi:hypothetical protein